MSGISGICYISGRSRVEHVDLQAMLSVQHVSGEGEPLLWSNGSVGFGSHKMPHRNSGISERDLGGEKLGLVVYGNLYAIDGDSVRAPEGADVAEPLLNLYLRDGISGLLKVRGEFVLAIWDGRSETLHLATDPFRVQPMFYYVDQEKLVFSSHLMGILRGPGRIRRKINPKAIVDLVAFSAITTPDTIYQDIKKLPPGHVLSLQKGRCLVSGYWDLDFRHPQSCSDDELVFQLKQALFDSIRVRYELDRESQATGAFLSGGIDSSTVNGLLSSLSSSSVKSFSIGFQEEPFNEIEYARIVARHFKLDHHEYFVTPRDVLNVLPLLVNSFDEPYANASAIPTYFCARLARSHGVNVLYAGDGGDELFAGNERYATERLFRYYSDLPKWLRRVIEPVVFGLGSVCPLDVVAKAKKYIRRASIPMPQRMTSYGIFNLLRLADYFEPDFLKSLESNYDPYSPVYEHYFRARALTDLDRHLYVDLKMTISDNDLFKVNRMTEAAGVVARYPFLDIRVAEFAATVPSRKKMKGTQLRTFFKKAYADLLPQDVISKTKHGFGLPIAGWLRTDRQLGDMVQDLVESPRALQRGYFNRKAITELIQRHKVEKSSFYGTILWNLMVLELWHRSNA